MILVVGGAGYIGSHVCKLLREVGEPHVVFDNLEKGHHEAIKGSPFVQGDLRSPDDLGRLFDSHQFDLAMHFAAYIEVGESVAKPAEFYENNVVGVLNLVNAMRAAGVERFVFSSTAAVFGEPEYVPIDEAHPRNPTSPYGDTKLAVERLLDAYDAAYGLKSVCLRYFNASGADPDCEIGEDHTPETHLIPRALLAILGKVPPLKLFGTDYPTPDGTCIRDYIHVSDLAQAHLLAAKHLRAGMPSAKFNLGTGTGYSVREVLDAAERVTGRPVPYEEAPRRAGDPARLVASNERAVQDLGWQPRLNDLDTIVRHAWSWFEAHPDGYLS